ncbi:MAG: hypothetical protein JST32_19445 [Bacteroidetes bacterium]|nr:hypothetical protein [Bacteroidota bacterium]
MKRAIKELAWILGTFITARLTYGIILGNSALDINMHDTYIVANGKPHNPSPTLFVFRWFIVLGIIAYLVRVLFAEFKIIVTDIILIVFAGLCLYFLGDIMFFLQLPGIWLVGLIKVFLIVVLTLTSLMIGKNLKYNNKLSF